MDAWALIDPHWGEPQPVLSTIRATEREAIEAALLCPEASLYSGASLHTTPARKGRWEPLGEQGYKIARVRITLMQSRY